MGEALPDVYLRAAMPGLRTDPRTAPGGPSSQVVWPETVPGPIASSGAGKIRRTGMAVGSMTLMRVIARTASGNAFARSDVWGHEAALALAREWIEVHEGLTVEVVGVYE